MLRVTMSLLSVASVSRSFVSITQVRAFCQERIPPAIVKSLTNGRSSCWFYDVSLRNVPEQSPRPPGVTRREFLDHGAHLALGFGALHAGLGRVGLLNGLGFPDVGEKAALPARAALTTDDISRGNDAITAIWSIADGVFRPVRFRDGLNAATLPVPAQAFTLTLADKRTIAGADMRITALPRTEILTANPRASRRLPRSLTRLAFGKSIGNAQATFRYDVWRGMAFPSISPPRL